MSYLLKGGFGSSGGLIRDPQTGSAIGRNTWSSSGGLGQQTFGGGSVIDYYKDKFALEKEKQDMELASLRAQSSLLPMQTQFEKSRLGYETAKYKSQMESMPKMDALRQGVMGRMAHSLGTSLPSGFAQAGGARSWSQTFTTPKFPNF